MSSFGDREVIGLIPAAGYATRVAPLPCSKEIYPVIQPDGSHRAVSSFLMESLRKASVIKTYLILRKGKWDIPAYFTNGTDSGLNLAYIITEATEGVPQTLDKAYPFAKKKKVLFGFPDILFQPSNACISLLEKQKAMGADLVLGLFHAIHTKKMDMIDFNEKGEIKDIVIKPGKTDLSYTWIIAVWTPVFTEFLHAYLAGRNKEDFSNPDAINNSSELYIGDVFRSAIQSGMKTSYVKFEEGSYIDIGTPSQLNKVNSIDWVRKFYSAV